MQEILSLSLLSSRVFGAILSRDTAQTELVFATSRYACLANFVLYIAK